jgi:hypothetical protein
MDGGAEAYQNWVRETPAPRVRLVAELRLRRDVRRAVARSRSTSANRKVTQWAAGVSVLAEDHDLARRQLASKGGDRFAGLDLQETPEERS